MKILETKRLLLRHLVPDDLDSLWALYCDSEVSRYIPDAPQTYFEAKEELEWFLHGHPKHPQLGLWATIYKENGRLIGRCGLLPWTIDDKSEIEVAYLIARTYWNQGLGTEAAQAILNYGFNQLYLERLICLIEQDNHASCQVAKHIGMEFEKEGLNEKGAFLLYSISKKNLEKLPKTGLL